MGILKSSVNTKILKYCLFLGMLGGIATLIGPNRHNYIKILIGITVGCMILGEKLSNAIKAYLKTVKESFNNRTKN